MVDNTEVTESNLPRRRWFRKKRFLIPLVLLAALAGYATWDYYPPSEIPLEKATIWGLSCLQADELLVQQYDSEGNLWATRGMWAYRLHKGDDKFVRQYHIPTGFSPYWLRNFSLVRQITNKPRCVELLPEADGRTVVMSAGHMWYRSGDEEDFEKTFTLRHYGPGIGSGMRSIGICRLEDGTLFFGEYWGNPIRSNVNLYVSKDGGKSWQVAYTFKPKEIRHIHGVQEDPYRKGDIWICTGDRNEESLVARSSDGGKTWQIIGQGKQRWRVCQFQFTPEAVYWAADTHVLDESGIYRYDRKTHQVIKLAKLPGCVLYATKLADGTLVWGINREGANTETDDKTRLYICTDGKTVTPMVCDTWKGASSIRWFKAYAFMRFSRDNFKTDNLVATCLGIKEAHNEDLLIIPGKELRRMVISDKEAKK